MTENLNPKQEKGLILFDGYCHVCSNSVQFVLKREKGDQLKFASLQSDFARGLLEERGYDANNIPDSLVFIDSEKVFFQSDAALEIARYLVWPWRWLIFFKLFPAFLRNHVYNWIARNRYRWWGKRDTCWLPNMEWKHKFL